jgi:hypothetical protein
MLSGWYCTPTWGLLSVAHAHDDLLLVGGRSPVVGPVCIVVGSSLGGRPGGDVEAVGQVVALDGQRVVSSHLEGVG